jgi:RecG-like helicase
MSARLTSTSEDLEAAELQHDSRALGALAICDCVGGERATVRGTIRSVTLRPRGGAPALEAELYDGSGRLRLVWMGRRRIAGIEPGRVVKVSGRITCNDDLTTMFNPRYELTPLAAE